MDDARVKLFMHKNYLYTINSVSKRDPKRKFDTCVERKTCGGRVHVQDGKYLKMVTEHSHQADQAKVEAKSHPNVFKLINALKSIQQMNMVTIEKLIAGEKPKKGNKIYQIISERMQNVVLKFNDEGPLLEFLLGCAHNISL